MDDIFLAYQGMHIADRLTGTARQAYVSVVEYMQVKEDTSP